MARVAPGGNGNGVTVALIYTRVSSDEQAREGLSLATQLEACRRYAADRGWILGHEYQDVLSGRRDDRPAYLALLAEARRLAGAGKPVAVVVARLDRFGRRLMERVRSRGELKALGVETHSVREGGLVNDVVAGVLAVLAEEEVERLGERVSDTRQHNVTNGWHVPGRAALGYRWRPAAAEEHAQGAPRSVLIVDEQAAPVVREMFRMVAAGELTARGATVWLAGQYPEQRIHSTTVKLMLEAPVYAGRFPDGARGRWEPLVSDETWQAVQARLTATKGRSGPVSGVHLLTGVLRCQECGGKMAGWTMRGRWKQYRCNGYGQGAAPRGRNCTGHCSAKTLDADVLRQVNEVLAPLAGRNPELSLAIGRAWERLRKPNDVAAKDRARLLAKARRDLDDAKRRIADAARLLVDGVVDRVAYQALTDAETLRLESAERTLARPELMPEPSTALPPWQTVLADLGDWSAVIAGDVVPEQRRVLALLIERVVPVKVGFGKYSADITWTATGDALRDVAGT